jgi:DNA-binding beta-propeller fold protein YncE
MTTVGTGKYTYQLIENWAKLPPGETFGNTSAVATDSQDRVYVFQRKDPPVVVFDRDGNYLRCWGIGAFANPHGIYIANDVVYLTDREDSVCLTYTLDGKPLQVLGQRGVHSDTGCEKPGDLVPRAAGPFNYPTEMVPAPSGDLYVSDGYRNARVHRFAGDGRLLMSWGQPGKTEPNHFHLPHSLVVHQDGTVYVCDRENNRLQVFSADGQFITMWTDMRRPLDISIDRDGILYISEGGARAVTPDQPDGQAGQRSSPVGLAVGPRQLGGCPRRHLPGTGCPRAGRQVRAAGLNGSTQDWDTGCTWCRPP